ncbi:DUF3274 domain-containing protein [Trinickia caryophylli]|uniref:DUF3274 domain-containing protein n=1 Tax=Trinickia caryophylli TaxID=28094 RepID=A0A1X7FMG8_TRICW|nr:DUF3274 domain-containing protein [Trinickia caryophylli]PMS13824.1 DUF3274 domain-containing protein [Trinickia caryophylli]TRX14319.1 DUF3274 domain-containing protein [Trinickia caryophylli]WQE14151.1 DUF3274 domain-containing protein [Trinickia caryophylli]SMF54899.1 Protein of unknown function [Trinickia caryophylli]GLU33350.1 hypothetical protein Busp01_31920 [Trinickia caryophylli]
MSNANDDYRVVTQAAAVTHANRAGDRQVALPRDLPGIVIFIHGVNDPGATYSFVEEGLCQGLNERLSRDDLRPGSFGAKYHAAAKRRATKQKIGVVEADILDDPDLNLYQRTEIEGSTHSGFIPFYWGYRASSENIARLNNPGDVSSRTADADGNLMTRGQYQDIHGNRLDRHFGKCGGFFANATNNIPDMYGPGFKADFVTRQFTRNALGGNSIYAADAPDRRYFVLAATRLANLISTIRSIKPKAVAESHGLDPRHETITIMGHSQGTLLTLLAQAILKQKGQRCVDCIIMVDSPYGLYETEECTQTGHAKLKTLIDIVNAVTSEPYSVPALADMLIGQEKHGGRAGAGWSPTQGKRRDRNGKDWITFDERDNRGKVYLYFCPEDTVVGLKKVHGIGTFGVPDEVPADGAALASNPKAKTMKAMAELEHKRFFQRMWTRMERDRQGNGKRAKVLVGMKPARVPVRENLEPLAPGPDAGASMLGTAVNMTMNVALQASFKRNDIRYINGEELKPPCEPQLYGGEIVVGGPRPGRADVAAQMVPDDVSKNVILGNQYAKLKWITDSYSTNPAADLLRRKAEFNADQPIDGQSHNWTFGGSDGLSILREETPNEARKRLATDPNDYEDNSYHSAVLHSAENHRWVTAMDVAIGQAVTLDDPVWRELLILMADWKLTDDAMTKIRKNGNFSRLSDESKQLINACWGYYSSGAFPDAVVSDTPPNLVTRELTPKAQAARWEAEAAQRQAEAAHMESEQRFYQDQMARNWGNWGSVR